MTSPSAAFMPLVLEGGTLYNNRRTEEIILSASMSLSTDQETEVTFELRDPNHAYFRSFKGDRGPIGKKAAYEGVPYECAAVSLSGGPVGEGITTLRFRPLGIEKLRKVTDALTRTNISSTTYVRDAVMRQGMKFVGQATTEKPSIARDVASQGGSGEANEWTTIKGLAGEEGFLAFENLNTLYYGTPQWFFDKQPSVKVSHGVRDGFWPMMSTPAWEMSRLKDDDELSFELPLQYVGKIRPGMGVEIVGVPFVPKKLLVTSIAYPLAGQGVLAVTAQNPWVIEKVQRGAKEYKFNFSYAGGSGALGPGGKGKRFYASEICAAAKARNLGRDGARNGIATALVESNLTMYANRAVPASLNYPHDAVGSDHDSVGLFQQRQAGWGTLAQRMNPRASAGLFFDRMMTFNWRAMDPGAACQRVQVSAYPGRYSQRMGEAVQWVNQVY
ncbi:minor tail protein [Gordonia phage DalanDe]|nr:minor tail protein [Gordonia phage DalanDe]